MKKPCLSGLLIFLWALYSPVQVQAALKSAAADYKATITPILELTISQTGQSELKFGDISPSSSGPTAALPKIIVVEVKSNTGERYQVTQKLAGPLQNAAGDGIELENLKFRSRSEGGSGNPVTDLTPATDSAQTVFVSDNAGTSEVVSIEYELTIPPTQAPGDYSSFLTYTASSL